MGRGARGRGSGGGRGGGEGDRRTVRARGGVAGGRCWIMPPAARIDDASRRLREAARPCPPPDARRASRLGHPFRARGATLPSATGGGTVTSGSNLRVLEKRQSSLVFYEA